MSPIIMYSALGSSEDQETYHASKTNTIIGSSFNPREEPELPAISPLLEPSDTERTPFSDTWVPWPHPTKYVEAVATPANYSVEARLLFPSYRPTTHKFQGDPDDKGVFLKKQNFTTKHRLNDDHFAECTAQEIKRCEQISRHPHQHLAQYLGVETQKISGEERVTRIAYKRYSMDLHTFVLKKQELKPHHIPVLLHGIKAGMEALHRMGLVHCDLRPANVFVTVGEERDEAGNVVLEEVVLGDFDASVKVGEEVLLKRASSDWWPEHAKWGMKADTWVDEWCLEKMARWLDKEWTEDSTGDYGSRVLRSASKTV